MFRFLYVLLVSPVLACAGYHSQFSQDLFINEYLFQGKRDGVFLDIGASNGVQYSNSLYFEEELGWSGIAFEPIPETFQKLKKRRSCHCIQGCIGPRNEKKVPFLQINGTGSGFSGLVREYSPAHRKKVNRICAQKKGKAKVIYVDIFVLNEVLETYGVSHINLLSLDTEGGELNILRSIDYKKFTIDVITVENNYKDGRFNAFLRKQGFTRVAFLGVDEVYVRNEVLETIPPLPASFIPTTKNTNYRRLYSK